MSRENGPAGTEFEHAHALGTPLVAADLTADIPPGPGVSPQSDPARSDPVFRLILLRHAKAEHFGGDDILRPLTLAGRRQARRVGADLRELGLIPEYVLCSSALRTRQTWELAATQFGDAAPEVVFSDDVYDAGMGDILEAVRGLDHRVRTVLVVGHEPTMGRAAYRLADAARADADTLAQVRFGVPTAAYSVLESAAAWDVWERGVAALRMVGVAAG